MFKQLWASIAALKTPERRLLFGLMLLIIVVLWNATRNNDSAKDIRIENLEKIIREKEQEKETQRILMEDKNDQLQEKLEKCTEEKYKDLRDMLDRAEKLKKTIREKTK